MKVWKITALAVVLSSVAAFAQSSPSNSSSPSDSSSATVGGANSGSDAGAGNGPASTDRGK